MFLKIGNWSGGIQNLSVFIVFQKLSKKRQVCVNSILNDSHIDNLLHNILMFTREVVQSVCALFNSNAEVTLVFEYCT